MKIRNVCIVVLALIFSCQSKVSEDENNSKKTYLSHQIEELVIELNDSLMNDCPYSSRYISEDGQLYLVGFNESYHKLDIFNLDQSKFEFDIPLEKEGPNAVIDPWDFYIVSFDSIYFLGKDSKLSLINKMGQVSQSYNLNETGANGREANTIGFKAHPILAKIHFDRTSNIIFFGAYSWKFPPFDLEYFDEPFLAFLDLNKEKIELILLEYPEIYKVEDRNFGEAFDPNIVFHEGKIIYSFPIVPDIFVYDMKTKIVESYPAKSDLNKIDLYTLNKEDYIDIQNRMIARIENPYYYHVIPDNKNDLYYRIHTAGIKYDLGNEEFGKGSDKSVYIQILDDDFDTIEEIELPKNTYDALSTFVNKEGDLLIPKTHYLNPDLKEDKLIFDKFIFKFK
ncbi:DUF4221 family protein [Belliella pelovolcani]|uniref:DUF4221 domain-containing protein n=1 Tax=Belliella pelovolcani TaxID=529505 RepID=A0A1N7LJY2_9BACT|nr:DUF4221 family protein [Belliella pelovolcani]SIS74094.1 protein of unknown function [Belliella pelovolcani]